MLRPAVLRPAALLLAAGVAATVAATPEAATVACPPAGRIMVASREPPLVGVPPPTEMPAHLEAAYTRCGTIPVLPFYVDDTNGGAGMRLRMSRSRIDEGVARARTLIQRLPAKMAVAEAVVRMPPQLWVTWGLTRHRTLIEGGAILVVGSNSVTVESVLLALGAKSVVVAEYAGITYDHPALSSVTDLTTLPAGSFDAIVAISALDHDGLGRYGDPLAPDGDLLTMDALARLLRPEGKLFLTVPVGPDAVGWNLMRRYGPIRLPLLLAGWDVEERIGWDATVLTTPRAISSPVEPLHVLRIPPPPSPPPTPAHASEL